MPQKKAETFTAEEEEVVTFFMELVPILEEAIIDLKQKDLLDVNLFTKKNS